MYCVKCNQYMSEGSPYFQHQDKIYCGDCAFLEGLIDEYTLKKTFYYFIPFEIIGNPIVKNNEVIFVSNSYLKKRKTREERRTPEYYRWRKSVYERNNYTCQICGQRGGELNAHHIKLFSKDIEKRIDINNGITLCKKCHKKVHGGKICLKGL